MVVVFVSWFLLALLQTWLCEKLWEAYEEMRQALLGVGILRIEGAMDTWRMIARSDRSWFELQFKVAQLLDEHQTHEGHRLLVQRWRLLLDCYYAMLPLAILVLLAVVVTGA